MPPGDVALTSAPERPGLALQVEAAGDFQPLHRNATTPPMASAWPSRPMAVRPTMAFCAAGLLRMAALLKSVTMPPGATVLARMPRGPYSRAT